MKIIFHHLDWLTSKVGMASGLVFMVEIILLAKVTLLLLGGVGL